MRRLFFIIILSVLVFFALNPSLSFTYEKEIKSLSSAMAEDIVKAGKKTIAVVDFVDLQGNVTELGRFLAEEFSVALAGAGKGFEVVDRTHLKSILSEHKLSTTGLIDPQTARKLGQIVGVSALLTGTVTPFGDSVRLSVKILDTTTARVIGASSCDIPKTKAIGELLSKEMGGQIPVPGTPALPHPMAKQSTKAQNFTFELIKTEAYGGTVTIDLLITNNDPTDRMLVISPHVSFIVDNFGNKYGVTETHLGTSSSQSRGGVASQLLVSGVPTKAKVISQISPKAQKIALLEIGCGGERSFSAQFRNIVISP